MLILFMGPTASGKTTLLNEFVKSSKKFESVVRYTTRSRRENETDGVDYHFISLVEFNQMISKEELVEFEEYSENRLYGTTKSSLISITGNHCSTITPSGLLQVVNSGIDYGDILVVYCTCSLKTQIQRYIDRKSDFDVSDKLEMCDRLARDEGMFKGVSSLITSAKKIYSGLLTSIIVNTEIPLGEELILLNSAVDNIKLYKELRG